MRHPQRRQRAAFCAQCIDGTEELVLVPWGDGRMVTLCRLCREGPDLREDGRPKFVEKARRVQIGTSEAGGGRRRHGKIW